MKVLCISDGLTSLTKGKWYRVNGVVEEYHHHYLIINDRGNKNWYNKKFFKTQGEVRDEKFKQLGL